jgi:hypothetical protein
MLPEQRNSVFIMLEGLRSINGLNNPSNEVTMALHGGTRMLD